MFDVPVDALYVWLGVSVVSLAAFGVVVALPSAAPPDATGAARAVDAVAVEPVGSRASYALDARRIELGPQRIGLAGPGGRSHAAFAYGPVTPALENGELERVVAGEQPRAVFDSRSEFAAQVATAQNHSSEWRPAPNELRVRRVNWGDVNATLVG